MSLSHFHDVHLPVPLALASVSGPERRVEIVTLASGREVRNASWAGSRRRWDIGSAVTRPDTLQSLIAFFEARGGALHSFRFRDPLDHASANPITPLDCTLGTGNGDQTAFKLVKSYGAFQRRILKPVAASVRAAIAGVETACTVDAASGLVTFSAPPPAGALVTAGFSFDCPVRFDLTRLDISLETFGAGRALSIPLIELIGDD